MNAPEAFAAAGETTSLCAGQRLGDFLITRVVGQGGFGIVYEAEDLTLQRRVAIKEYMPSQLAARIGGTVNAVSDRYAKTFELGRRSFLAEARLLAQFRHPGLLEVLHFWEQNGTAYMVMPFY
ncbi:MAG TPA: serine/threonine protein kinase, partial [Zeimonas sp.]